MTVAALLVSHGGARWLPAVLEGLREQTRPVDFALGVDTGSKDDSATLVSEAFGADRVVRADRSTGWGAAVALGLEALAERGQRPDWVWLLHDDSRPHPEALEWLLLATEEHPDADVLGPKLREWPSLRRLLEVGLTISGTGRRETGLEHGEYDQGQHDVEHTVLAVNTAGMLVRREVLERLDGFDPELPVFGNDLDFGWRAAAAGHRTLVVPQAVVFHAEAAHRGLRTTPLTGRHTHYQERRAALYTLLVNAPGRRLPLQLVRLTLGTVLRALGFLLMRSVGEAADELAALGSLWARPGMILRARRRRRALSVADPTRVRALLAPWWLPYRHGLDVVAGVVGAAGLQARDVAERRRRAASELELAAPSRRPVVEEDDLEPDQGLLVRFLTSPMAVALALFCVLGVWGAREAFGTVSGGALSPAPNDVAAWWDLHVEQRHALGVGTDAPAPPYLPVLAGIATLLGGSPTAAVSAVMLSVVPVAALGAWRLTGALQASTALAAPAWLRGWTATTYALVAVTSGAWGDGRLGTVVVTAVLPWLVHSALGLAHEGPDRRRRAAWRTGAWLAVAVSFAPLLWWVALLGVVTALVLRRLAPEGPSWRGRSGLLGIALAVPLVLLVPWWLTLLVQGRVTGLWLDFGRPPAPAVGPVDLLTATMSPWGIGAWWGGVLVLLAVFALWPGASRAAVLGCWAVIAVTVVTAAAASWLRIGPADLAPGLGAASVLVAGAAVLATLVAAASWLRGRPRPVVGVAGLLLALLPTAGLGWFAAADDTLTSSPQDPIPAYMQQSSLLGPAHGVLVLEGGLDEGLTHDVRRGDGLTVGEDEIVALEPEDPAFTSLVSELVFAPTPEVVDGLAGHGIEYVVLAAPADGRVAATLDGATGLEQASIEDRTARAWHVSTRLAGHDVTPARSWWRTSLVALQALAILVVAVLCGPAREEGES